MAKLALGTVQFGTDYGITNERGQTPLDEVEAILELAARSGIDLLDTARLYGVSEAVLGKLLGNCHEPARFDIVTKTDQLRRDRVTDADVAQLRDGFRASLEALSRDSVYGLLVHHAPDLLAEGGAAIWEWLTEEKEQGTVTKIGYSVYGPEQLSELLENYEPDLVQLPTSVFDQQFDRSGLLDEVEERGVEVHVRSVFLQGLVFQEPQELPEYFAPVADTFERFHDDAHKLDLSPLEMALAYPMQQDAIDRLVVGVENPDQLSEIVAAAEATPPDHVDWSRYDLEEERWTNPSHSP